MEPYEFTVDKFTFRVAADRVYTADGLWALAEEGRVRVGVTDFFQQNSGDVAFAEVAGPGATVVAGEPLANIETIKVDVELPSPVSGTVIQVNERLELEAEIINQDPYGAGWLAVIEPTNWAAERVALMSAEAYTEYSRVRALEDTGRK